MADVINRHVGDVPIRRAFEQKALHHRAHAQQRRERQPHRPIAHIGAGQDLEVDILRAFLIEPAIVESLALELLATALIGLEPDRGDTARHVPDLHGVELVSHATR